MAAEWRLDFLLGDLQASPIASRLFETHRLVWNNTEPFSDPPEAKPSSEAVAEYLEGRKQYEGLRKRKEKGSNREQQVRSPPETRLLGCCWGFFFRSRHVNPLCPLRQTLALLNSFKTKLTSAIAEGPEEDVEDEEEDDDDDKGW